MPAIFLPSGCYIDTCKGAMPPRLVFAFLPLVPTADPRDRTWETRPIGTAQGPYCPACKPK